MASQESRQTTAPEGAKREAAEARSVINSGVATKYWLEALSLPAGPRRLWLFVGGGWQHLDSPSLENQLAVQDAFCSCPDRLEVAVWYSNGVIVGLVVRSK